MAASPACASALFTDLYELTMLQAYVREGMTQEAVFTLSVRRLPRGRNYLVAAGLGTVLDCLENLRFTDAEIDYLATLGMFAPPFLDWLREFRFTGDVHAVPEGTPVFPDEPILEVVAPLPEAQFIETLVMNQIHLQTMLASKAARVVTAAEGRTVVDFGARRMHGMDAALKAARAFSIAGVGATSNVEAGMRFGLPVTGTMAHSYIQAHDSEDAAFAAFAAQYPGTTLLVDTYDTLDGVKKVIALMQVPDSAIEVNAIRLDSGDIAALAQEARRLLDAAGLGHVQIFASGGFDEYKVADLVAAGAPVDGFGVGTSMGVSADAPSLDMVYKLCEYGGTDRVKTAADKPVLPGRKQIFRGDAGDAMSDVIAGASETLPGRPLLAEVMRKGHRTGTGTDDLGAMRARCQRELTALPATIRGNAPAERPFPVRVSDALRQRQAEAAERARRT